MKINGREKNIEKIPRKKCVFYQLIEQGNPSLPTK